MRLFTKEEQLCVTPPPVTPASPPVVPPVSSPPCSCWPAWSAPSPCRRERRAYLALAISIGLISAKTVTRLAHVAGKGI